MTLDELLLEWSYRSEKGYPSLDNPSDISILKQILEKLNLPSSKIISNLYEAILDPSELRKDRIGTTKGIPGIRVKLFLDKINKGDEFELMDNTTVIIDKEQSQEAVNRLEQYLIDFKDNLNQLTFKDADGKEYPLRSNGVFKKTAEFGSSGGQGGGTAETEIQESAHAYGCAIAYYINKGPITEEDLNKEKFEQAAPYVDAPGSSVEEILSFLEKSPLWTTSIPKSVNKIYELFPNNDFKIHRGSEQVEIIYKAFSAVAKKEADLKLNNDKWNPADIWLISNKLKNHDWSGNLEVLNGQIHNFFDDNELIGISLKQIPSKDNAKSEVYNDFDIPKGNTFKYVDYKTTLKSSGLEILYSDGSKEIGTGDTKEIAGKLGIRNFSVDTGWCAEISGKAARGGKACHGAINDVLRLNNIDILPTNQDVLKAFKTDNEQYYDKFYYLVDRFIENISKEDFANLYEKSELSWKTSNYMSLEFLSSLEDNLDKADEIINDIMRYAASSTKASSKFIKIS
jgi:Fe-S cluster assembly iron-binding protein IscA